MKFTLEIELDNDEMQTADDVGRTLKEQGCYLRGCTFEAEDSGIIRDLNGKDIGKWSVADSNEDAEVEAVAGLLWDYLKRDTEHKDRRQTGFGTKTKTGLLRSIKSILEHRR